MGKELDGILQQRLNGGDFNFSYVLQTYTTDDGVLWQHKYTSPKLLTVNTTGVKEVDENTVHRIGSISKMLTVYTFLVQIGDGVWNDPVTKYIPELRSSASDTASRSVYHVDWNEVTVGSLASFESGLMRDCKYSHHPSYTVPGAKLMHSYNARRAHCRASGLERSITPDRISHNTCRRNPTLWQEPYLPQER